MLDQLEIMADIGAEAREHGVLQPLRIFVSLKVTPPDADRIDRAFDYRQLRAIAERLAARRTVLIETFARDLAEQCLGHPLVDAADVRIEKPRAVPDALAGTRVFMRKIGAAGA